MLHCGVSTDSHAHVMSSMSSSTSFVTYCRHLRAVFWDAWTRDMTDADQAHRLKAGMEARMADCKAKWPARLPPQPDWELWI